MIFSRQVYILSSRCAHPPQVPILLGTNRDEGSTFTGNQTGTGDGQYDPQSFYYDWLYSPEQAHHHGGSTGGIAEGIIRCSFGGYRMPGIW